MQNLYRVYRALWRHSQDMTDQWTKLLISL